MTESGLRVGRLVAGALALMLAIVAGQARAGTVTIPTLFNTGVADGPSPPAGTVLPDGTVGDPHYALTGVPSGSVSTILVRRATTGGAIDYPIPPYLGNDTLSAWIGPDNTHDLHGPVGDYTYETTFDLAGFDPTTASITGRWSSDNPGMEILINGILTPGNEPTSSTQYSSWASFSITSGFMPGINTLDFVVHNDTWPGHDYDNPTALRVEMVGAAVPVPEPISMIFFGSGLVAIGGYMARRRTARRA